MWSLPWWRQNSWTRIRLYVSSLNNANSSFPAIEQCHIVIVLPTLSLQKELPDEVNKLITTELNGRLPLGLPIDVGIGSVQKNGTSPGT